MVSLLQSGYASSHAHATTTYLHALDFTGPLRVHQYHRHRDHATPREIHRYDGHRCMGYLVRPLAQTHYRKLTGN